jgi:hypothetical protein
MSPVPSNSNTFTDDSISNSKRSSPLPCKHALVPECCNATDVFRLSSYIARCVCCNNSTYRAGKFVFLRSKAILVRKLPAMTPGAGSVLWTRRAWHVKQHIDIPPDGASAFDRAAKQHKQTSDVRCNRRQHRQGDAKVTSRLEVTLLYAFFWVIPRRLKFTCRRFGTLCPIFIGAYEDRT